MFTDLPAEILLEIISHAFRLKTNRVGLLLTCSAVHAITVELLYRNLRFNSRAQLESFIKVYRSHPNSILVPPCSIELELANDRHNSVFTDVHSLLVICTSVKDIALDERGRLALDLFALKCNSYGRDELESVQACIGLVNPRCFIWTGVDPPHHFSIAIVQPMLKLLLESLKSCTRLAHLKLTHCSFSREWPIIPEFRSLKTLHIGQAICFPVESLAYIVAISKGMPELEEVRLVDVYLESIWGLRVRRSNIEGMAEALVYLPCEKFPVPATDNVEQGPPSVAAEAAIQRIRQIVVCEAQTERLIGGDRVSGDMILI